VGSAVRALCALVALVSALATSSVANAQADMGPVLLSNEISGTEQCGPNQVFWDNSPMPTFQQEGQARLRATLLDGQPIFDVHWQLGPGERLIALWCADLLGDGRQAIAYERFSGGAHCCYAATVLLIEPGAVHLLDVDLGNGGLVEPRQIDGVGPLELPTTSDVFAYFDDLAYAASPVLPMVLAYDGTRYVEATRRFTDLLADEARQAQAELREVVARQTVVGGSRFDYEEQVGMALRLYGLHVLLGDADQALPGLKGLVAPPVAEWLDVNAQPAVETMRRVYHID
jgi:hypothetical protein